MKDNINKVVNLNKFICEMSIDYEIITYAESYMFYNFVQYNKIHTLLYHDYDIHMFVQDNNYCFITVKGTHKEYNNLNDFIKNLNRYLDLLYLLDKIIYGC